MDTATAPLLAETPAPADRVPRLRAAALEIARRGPQIVDQLRPAMANDRFLEGLPWLVGPVATAARLQRLADAFELSASGELLRRRDLTVRGDRATAELRPRRLAEQRLYRDEPVRFFFDASSPSDVLAALPSHAIDATVDVGDPITAEVLAPLAGAGLVRLVDSAPRAAEGENVTIVLPAFHAMDELTFIARRLAGQVRARRAFGLGGPTVILVATYWRQRAQFVELFARALATAPAPLGTRLVEDEADEGARDATVRVEGLGSHVTPDFLATATARANELGALSVEIVAHVVQEEDPVIAAAIDRAIEALRASSIGVNEWPEMARVRGVTPELLPRTRQIVVSGPSYRMRRPLYAVDAFSNGSQRGASLLAFHAKPGVLVPAHAKP